MNDSFIHPSATPALASQRQRLDERKTSPTHDVLVCGTSFVVDPGVYDTSVDTELMAEMVALKPEDRFLEIGCGTGAVSLLLAKRCAGGIATDINPQAIENARKNANLLGVSTVQFVLGDGFADLSERFAAVICNPPYNNQPVRDAADRMFWDPDNHVKKSFFTNAHHYLLPDGRLYFGWANFADIDVNLPFRLAEEHHFKLVRQHERPSHSGKQMFYVMEFKRRDGIRNGVELLTL